MSGESLKFDPSDPEQLKAMLLGMPQHLRGQVYVQAYLMASLVDLHEEAARIGVAVPPDDIVAGILAAALSFADHAGIPASRVQEAVERIKPVEWSGGVA